MHASSQIILNIASHLRLVLVYRPQVDSQVASSHQHGNAAQVAASILHYAALEQSKPESSSICGNRNVVQGEQLCCGLNLGTAKSASISHAALSEPEFLLEHDARRETAIILWHGNHRAWALQANEFCIIYQAPSCHGLVRPSLQFQ